MGHDGDDLVIKWLQSEFKVGYWGAKVLDFVLDFLHMRQVEPVKLLNSRYPELRKHGVKLIKDEMKVEELLDILEERKYNPFRFSDLKKKVGYLFTVALSLFGWITLLTYIIQFGQVDDPLTQSWIQNLGVSALIDAVISQPLTYLMMTWMVFFIFGKIGGSEARCSELIKNYQMFVESVDKFHETQAGGGGSDSNEDMELADVKEDQN